MTAEDVICAARLKLFRKHPYFACEIFALRLHPHSGVPTMIVTGGGVVFYNPATVLRWGPDATAAVLFHESEHLRRAHAERGAGKERYPWRLAKEAAINDGIVAAGWRLPDNPILPSSYGMPNDLSEEEYYELLRQQGKRGDEPAGDRSNLPPGCGGQCGGVADDPHPAEASLPDDAPAPMTEPEKQVMRRVVAQAIKQAAGRGNLPGSWRIWAEEQLAPPRVPWTSVLGSIIRGAVSWRAGQGDYSWSRPSRRYGVYRRIYGPRAPILPAIMMPVPSVSVVLDTSGSMTYGGRIIRAASEVMGIVKAVGVAVSVYATDGAVQDVANVTTEEQLRALFKGAGGTDMRVGIKAADEANPDLIVCVSDGQSSWPTPETMPRARLVVACVTSWPLPNHIASVRAGEDE